MKLIGAIKLMRPMISSCRGTSGVELAIVAPFLALMVIGITDLSRGAAYKLQMQQAVHRGLEMLTVAGQAVPDATIKAEAESAGGTGSTATVTRWLECDNVTKTTATCPASEQTARYIRVSITGNFAPSFKLQSVAKAFPGWKADGTIDISAQGVARYQ